MDTIEPKTLKGFSDFGPREQLLRQEMLEKIQDSFESFGFLPLSTPALEYKEILMNKYGEDEKLVYSFTDNGGREVAMRYDLTVPLARYVAENQNELVYPFKRYQIAPVWRADNPQKGRMREFFQCDVDTVGTISSLADAEIMACLCRALESLGVENYELRFSDRRIFSMIRGSAKEVAEIIRTVDKLEKIGAEKVLQTLTEKGLSANTISQVKTLLNLGLGDEAIERLARVYDGPSEAVNEIAELANTVANLGIAKDKVLFDPTIARGLDYYTGVIFEIRLKDMPQFGSIAGGGRYDNLIDQFSTRSISAVGGSIGVDRLFSALSEKGMLKQVGVIKAMVLNLDKGLEADYLNLVAMLRKEGINTELYYEPSKLDKQFKYAESKDVQFAIILGEEEKAKGIVQVKNLATREQKELKTEELMQLLENEQK